MAHGNLVGNWTLQLGRLKGTELRLHVAFPLLAVIMFWGAAPGVRRSAEAVTAWTPRTAAIGLSVLLASVACHEAARAISARRVGGRAPLVVACPWGSGAPLHLPADPPAHLATALAGPVMLLTLVVAAACALAASGDAHALRAVSLFHPRIAADDGLLRLVLMLTVWINSWLFVVNLAPIAPLDGAALLHGMLWPVVGQASAAAAVRHVTYGAALVAATLAVSLQLRWVNDWVPAWVPLAAAAVFLLFGAAPAAHSRRKDDGLAIDELESDDEQWLEGAWLREERAVVAVEQIQLKQQAALDRKRREREGREDERVDAILARIQEEGIESLNEDEQAILKRASRRYRQRMQRPAE